MAPAIVDAHGDEASDRVSSALARRLRVLVAEHHPLVREDLRYLIDAETDMECVGVAKNGQRALELCAQLRPEVLVVDDVLPGADGIAIAAMLGRRLPQIRVVIYTFDQDVCEVARGAGAVGCVIKDTPYDVLLGAVRQAALGLLRAS
jgi:DNA-binding NarL/FixJ family response regulator